MQIADILQLSVAERLQIVQDIWDSIAENPDELPLTESEKLKLDKRLKSYKQNSTEVIEWETLKQTYHQKKEQI